MRTWRQLFTGRERASQMPRIGLALGGGFARGIANIGVLEVLEEERIPIHLIAGTSSGSIIAAAYASGVSTQELTEAASRLRLRHVGRWSPSLLGFASNLRMEGFLRGLLRATDFAAMRIPLLIPATDFASGAVKIFHEGSVLEAVRASCAYPLVYQPVQLGEHYYLDGGLVCAVPARPLRAAGATRVIGVELLSHWQSGPPHNFMQVLGQAFSVAIMQGAETWRSSTDVLLQPNLEGIAYDAFDRYHDLIRLGRAAAQLALPQLRPWRGSAPPLPHRRPLAPPAIVD